MPTIETSPLPTPQQLALAEYKVGSYRSDLDGFLTTVRKQDPTPEQYLEALARDEDLQTPDLDPDELRRLIVFATDALNDAAAIEKDARELQQRALGLYHESAAGKLTAEQVAIQRRWHRQTDELLGTLELEGRNDA